MSNLIDRQAAIDALGEQPTGYSYGEYEEGLISQWKSDVETIKQLPSAEPFFDKEKVSDLLYHIYSICSPHTSAMGIIARNYYFKELGKELFGDDIPTWM